MHCSICGNKNNKVLKIKEMMFGTQKEFEYLECSHCGCLFIINPPEDLSNFYESNNYYSFSIEGLSYVQKFLQKKRDEYCLFKKGILGYLVNKKFPNIPLDALRISKVGKNNKILDVGCGKGNLLHSLKNLNFCNLTGIDPFLPDEYYSKRLKILKKNIFQLEDSEKYDLIMFHHSFEHMTDQSSILNKASNLLSKDGVCIIRMPLKTEYIWARYGIHWVQIDAPRHIMIHTLKSFNHLISDTPLEIEKIVFDSTDFQFWASEQYKMNIPYYSSYSYRNNPKNSIFTKKDISWFREKAKELNKKGLGDQALFILK